MVVAVRHEDVAPTITLHPVSRTVYYPTVYTLTANATPYTSVQWQTRPLGGSTWTDAAGGSAARGSPA